MGGSDPGQGGERMCIVLRTMAVLFLGVFADSPGDAQDVDHGWFRFRYDNDFFNATDR